MKKNEQNTNKTKKLKMSLSESNIFLMNFRNDKRITEILEKEESDDEEENSQKNISMKYSFQYRNKNGNEFVNENNNEIENKIKENLIKIENNQFEKYNIELKESLIAPLSISILKQNLDKDKDKDKENETDKDIMIIKEFPDSNIEKEKKTLFQRVLGPIDAGSIRASIFNLTIFCLGSGCLNIPQKLGQMSLILSVLDNMAKGFFPD